MNKKQNKPEESLPNLTKNLASVWHSMTLEEKKPFEILYQEDLKRYKTDVSNLNAEDKQFLRKERRQKRSLSRLKKPLTAYLFFLKHKRGEAQIDNPGANTMQIASLMGVKWRNLEIEEKKIYLDQAREAKEIYLKQISIV